MATIEQLKQLRAETGISINECKKALDEAGNDVGKAKLLLKEWGKEVADKKQAREVGEGLIDAYLHPTGKVASLVDIRCETDFVAKSDDFKLLVHEVAMQIASMDPENVEELFSQQYIKDSSKTIQDLVQEAIAKLGENIVVQRFERFEI